MRKWIESLEEGVLTGGRITEAEAIRLISLEPREVYELFPSAHRLARANKGWEVELCGIANAKSGRCPEDCAFCAQSAHHCTNAPAYDLRPTADLLDQARQAVGIRANRFGIITSGTGIEEGWELDRICETVAGMAAEGKVSPCASLGILSEATLSRLKAAGLQGYHHNLETARSFFPRICTTHDYEDDVATVAAAKRLGLMTCSGGIFGLGESPAQRVELAFTLRDLNVDSVPLNFLVPVAGTPMESMPPLEPLECLKIVAVFRFVLPKATIKVCAGRDRNLGDLASWIFYAGASGMMIGNYLTTAGREPSLDLRMLQVLGLVPVAER
ncbi:MAG: biotin synthase BioB [Deltaproteobacteria bacterium]|nr:biotin synthase BioB [Deltaproteobacteria bacterium]